MSRVALVVGALALSMTGGSVRAQSAPNFSVKAIRFYRPQAQKTLVKVFLQVPYALMEPTGDDKVAYTVSMQVKDSTGLTLLNQSWDKRAPGSASRIPGAYGLEQIEFAVAPGRYQIDVGVNDSVSGRSAKATTEFRGWGSAPVASDLLLSPAMREATDADTMPGPAEIRSGSTIITAAAHLRLTPVRDTAYYMVEAYNGGDAEAAGTIAVAVVDSAGKTLYQVPPQPVRVPSGGGVLKGQVNLEGLPEGRYTMQVRVAEGDTGATRTADFSMGPLPQAQDNQLARSEPGVTSDSAYFANMSEAQLDSAFAPLGYVAKGGELKVWKSGLSVEAKRRFLTRFWEEHDQNKGTPGNQFRNQFYGLIEQANQQFAAEGRSGVPGWKTDRGRVFIDYGAPDDVLRRPTAGQAPAYEVWTYTHGKRRWFIFADRTGFHNFDLINSNDLRFTGVPTWRDVLGEVAVRDIGNYLGVDFYSTSNASQLP